MTKADLEYYSQRVLEQPQHISTKDEHHFYSTQLPDSDEAILGYDDLE